MASWIVHLRLAENLLQLIDGLYTTYFAIGSIAPDSGIPDENREKFTPPREVTHFRAKEGAVWRIADLTFYRQHLAPLRPEAEDVARFSFLLGYFLHLVTDNLWHHLIALPTLKRFAAEYKADPVFRWEARRDRDGLSFLYVRDHPDSLFWRVFLHCEYFESYLDFLPTAVVQQHIDAIKTLYQRTDEEIKALYKRSYHYLTKAEIDRFVEETTQRLYGIYQYLWEGEANTSGFWSALELDNQLSLNEKAR
jgi:hypothetical protein